MSDSNGLERNCTDIRRSLDKQVVAEPTEIVMDKTDLSNSSARGDAISLPFFNRMPTISLNKHRIPIGGPIKSFASCPSNSEVDGYRGNSYSSTATWEDHHSGTLEKDNNPGRCGGRGRTTYSDDQITELEKVFSANPYPTPQSRQRLARGINVPEGKVKIWFQNRRARAKKQRNPGNGWRCGSMRVSYPPSLSSGDKRSKNTESGKPLFYRFQSSALQSGSGAELNTLATSYLSSGSSISADSGPLSLSHLSLCNPDKFASKREATATIPSSCLFNEAVPALPNLSNHVSASSTPIPLPKSSNSVPNVSFYPESAQSNEEQNSMYPPRFPVIHKKRGSSCQFGGQLISSNDSFYTEVPGYLPRSGTDGAKASTGSQLNQSYSGSTSSNASSAVPGNGNFANSLCMPPCSTWSNVSNKVAGNENLQVGTKGLYQKTNTSMCSNPGTLMQSPPPVRRFVFPFKTLLENARYTPMSLSSSVGEASPQEPSNNSCSFRHLPKVNSKNLNEELCFKNDSTEQCDSTSYEDTCDLKENKKSLSSDGQYQHQLEVQDLHGVDHRHQMSQIDRQRHWPGEFPSGATYVANVLSDSDLQDDGTSNSWYPNITAPRNRGTWNHSNCSQNSGSSRLQQTSHIHKSDVRRSDEDEWRGHIFPPAGKISTSTPVVR